MSLTECPACSHKIYEYRDGRWTEWICWTCGHYEPDTPAFKAYPYLLHDVVRKNSNYFLEKYARYGRGTVRKPKPSWS
ncbi:MAG: hypothetical protein E6K88_06290 [Thaumarchaeota archaeon]|nr:MAG: hypothetical protein E6K88_06290 [Nitrososphaerota archaeon]